MSGIAEGMRCQPPGCARRSSLPVACLGVSMRRVGVVHHMLPECAVGARAYTRLLALPAGACSATATNTSSLGINCHHTTYPQARGRMRSLAPRAPPVCAHEYRRARPRAAPFVADRCRCRLPHRVFPLAERRVRERQGTMARSLAITGCTRAMAHTRHGGFTCAPPCSAWPVT